MAGQEASEREPVRLAVEDGFDGAEPLSVVVLGTVAAGLAAALLVAIGELITDSRPGPQFLFGAAILAVVLGIGWLLSAVQARRSYVHGLKSQALDLAAEASHWSAEAQKAAIDRLGQTEDQLSNVGAYRAASTVAEARRNVGRIVGAGQG